MTPRTLTLLAGIVGGASWISAQDLARVPPEAVAARVGQTAAVCGLVFDLGCAAPDRTTPFVFHVTADAPDVSLALAPDARTKVASLLQTPGLFPQSVCATGQIEAAPRGFRVVVTRAEQVELGPGGPPLSPQPAGALYRVCDAGVRPPRMVRDRQPQYTADAMRSKIKGRIVLQGVVGTDGTVSNIQVLRSLDPSGLDAEAVSAFEQWQFEPGTRDGTAVPVVIISEFTFSMK